MLVRGDRPLKAADVRCVVSTHGTTAASVLHFLYIPCPAET